MFVVIVWEGRFKDKPADVICPNLSFDNDRQASCAVHNEPWYKETPCFVYGNSDVDPDYFYKRGKPCLVGKAVREKKHNVFDGAKTCYQKS